MFKRDERVRTSRSGVQWIVEEYDEPNGQLRVWRWNKDRDRKLTRTLTRMENVEKANVGRRK